MQHAACSFDPFDIPWILQNLLFSQTSFGKKISLIFPIIYQIAHLQNWTSFPLIFANNTLDDLFSSLGGYFEIISHSWLLNFIETRRASFDPFDITLKLISHAKTSFLINCAGGSLTDQIRAKYEQLDSGEFGSPGTPAFDAEACELANLLARVSQLCQRLNLPMPKELYRPTFCKHWRHFLDQNLHRQAVLVRVWRMQLCSHRYVRITGLLSAL